MHHSMRQRLSQITLAGVLAFSALSAQAASAYQIQLLETPMGITQFSPAAINDKGAIVGQATYPATGPYLWQGGSAQSLHSLLPASQTYAIGINNNGQIVGSANSQAVIWEQGQVKSLPGGFAAVAINDAGTVAGQAGTQAAIWEGGQLRMLTHPDHALESTASDISASGVVVGTSAGSIVDEPEFWYQALRWDGDQLTVLRAGPGAATSAVGVNDLGSIVGQAYSPDAAAPYSAVRWDGENPTLLAPITGKDNSSAFGINNTGLVVGYSFTGTDRSATLWEGDAAIDLTHMLTNGQGWDLWNATGINNLGQIIGFGTYEGRWAGYMLTPVPEADSLLMLGFGLPLVWGLRAVARRGQGEHQA